MNTNNPHLSPQELVVAKLLCQGLANKQIAHHLGLTQHTVKNYLYSIYQKLHVQTRIQAALTLVFTLGIIDISYVLNHQDMGQLPIDTTQSHTPSPDQPHPPKVGS